MRTQCSNLEEYLADNLPADQALGFERHLGKCDECRETIDQQRWIDNLLQSAIRLQLEPAPGELVETAKWSMSRRRRSGQLIACGLAAAALLFVAVGWLELNRQATGRVDQGASRDELAERVQAPVISPAKATFVGGADVIAVPVESHHSNVTIVRIYPTYRLPGESQTAATEPDTATKSTWPDYSSGG